MIYTIGDSHSDCTFRGVPGVNVDATPSFSFTMWRIATREDDVIERAVAALHMTPADTLILSAVEIDCRIHVKRLVSEGMNLEQLLSDMVDRYLTRALRLPLGGGRLVIMSVVPPAPDGTLYPSGVALEIVGTNEERVSYVRAMNSILASECQKLGLMFLDVYTPYADASGLLPAEISDGVVHIVKTNKVHEQMCRLGLLP